MQEIHIHPAYTACINEVKIVNYVKQSVNYEQKFAFLGRMYYFCNSK